MPETNSPKDDAQEIEQLKLQVEGILRKNSELTQNLKSSTYRFTEIIKTLERLVHIDFDLTAFMNMVVHEMLKFTPATGAVVELVEDKEMVYKAVAGSVSEHLGVRLARNFSLSGFCVDKKELIYCRDTEKDERVDLRACRRVGARSMVVAPLFHQGECVGVLKILAPTENAFGEDDIQTLQLMAGLIAAALAHQIFMESMKNLLGERTQALTELKKAQDHLKFLAHYDHLTNLASRSLFNDILRATVLRVQRSKRLIAVMYLDLDHFKVINDSFGHHVGDELLISFSKRLQMCIREADTAARLGGDEFVILIEEIQSQQNAIVVAERILKAMLAPFVISDHAIHVTISIGLAFYQGEDTTPQELISKADRALYQSKHEGRNTFNIHDDSADLAAE